MALLFFCFYFCCCVLVVVIVVSICVWCVFFQLLLCFFFWKDMNAQKSPWNESNMEIWREYNAVFELKRNHDSWNANKQTRKIRRGKKYSQKNENYVQQPRKKWINKYLKKATIIKLHRKNVDFIRKEMNDCS